VELDFGIVILSSGYGVALGIYLADIFSFPVPTTSYLELLLPIFFLRVCSQMPGKYQQIDSCDFIPYFFHYLLSSFAKFSFNSGYTSSKFMCDETKL
jgi:hypothetical protein